MKIPVNWIKEYVNLPESLKEFTDKMSMIGHLLDKTEEVDGETVVDLELRGNRADCYSIIGIARETAAAFVTELKVPDLKFKLPNNSYDDFAVEVKTPVVKRFYSTVIKNVKIAPSPDWMQDKLKAYGIDPINNIVDITNFVMVETGMPMHAFDLNRMDGKKLILRQSDKGEKFTTFDNIELELTPEDVVFGSEGGRVMGIAGIIGEIESGIHEDTTDILLECASYDRVSIRKSMFRHKAMTEAGLRHSHDLSSSLCDYALARAVDLIIELACEGKAENIQGLHDYYPKQEQKREISFDPNEVARLGGVTVDLDTQIDILRRLEFEVSANPQQERLEVTVPLFRTEIEQSADLVEEILRIYGYEKIPSTTLSSVIPDPIIQPELVLEERSKDILTALGLDEIITVPMNTVSKIEKSLEPKKDLTIGIINPSSSEHTHMRISLYPGLLDAATKVLDRGDERVGFFEVGKVYLKKAETGVEHQPPHKPEFPYVEYRRITALVSTRNRNESDFYSVKSIVEEYLKQLLIENIEFEKFDHPQLALAASIKQGENTLGEIGVLKREITEKSFGIKSDVYVFTFSVESLVEAEKTPVNYEPYSEFPAVKQDMSVEIILSQKSLALNSAKMIEKIKEVGGDLLRNVEITDVYEKEGKRSLLFSMTYQAKERTLSTEEVNNLHSKIAGSLKNEFNVEIKGQNNPASLAHNPESSSSEEKHSATVFRPQEKVVVGRIVEVKKHPNADRLVITKVDVGSAKPQDTIDPEYLQVVTGASNIRVGEIGMFVPVALPGAVVTSHRDGSTITIKSGELRGEKSEGMLCSSDELHLPNPGYDGIYILSSNYSDKIGMTFEPVTSSITTLVFDWSKVCTRGGMVEPLSNFLSERLGRSRSEINTVLKQVGNKYLAGQQSGEEFLQDILKALGMRNVSTNTLLEALSVDSDVNSEMLDFIKSLRGKYEVVLFSDCPREKAEYITQKYQLDSIFNKLVFSYETGAVRPDSEAFMRLIEIAGLNPETSLMIDDRIDNLNRAKEFGFQTLMYVSLQVLKDALKNNFGLDI